MILLACLDGKQVSRSAVGRLRVFPGLAKQVLLAKRMFLYEFIHLRFRSLNCFAHAPGAEFMRLRFAWQE